MQFCRRIQPLQDFSIVGQTSFRRVIPKPPRIVAAGNLDIEFSLDSCSVMSNCLYSMEQLKPSDDKEHIEQFLKQK